MTIISLFCVPLLWSLPQGIWFLSFFLSLSLSQPRSSGSNGFLTSVGYFLWICTALMAAELSLMMDDNGGNIIWVQRAFGSFIGWINAYNYIISCFASLALYPILFVDYMPSSWVEGMNMWETSLLKAAFCFVITLINIWGISWVSRLSLFFLFFIISPFVAEAISCLIIGGLQYDRLADFPSSFTDIKWALFLSTTLWSFGKPVCSHIHVGWPTFFSFQCELSLMFSNY